MESLSRRLETAIRQMDRRLRDSSGDDQQIALEAAREELNAVLDEASYSRRSHSPGAASGLRSTARRLGQATQQGDQMQAYHALQEEIRWVDEESSQARKEMEDRLEGRIVAMEARMTALVAVNNETDTRLRELERRAEIQENMAKRNRLTIEELADKVSQVVNDLQQRLLASVEEVEPQPAASRSLSQTSLLNAAPREARSSRGSSRSDLLIRELAGRVESLERELEGERERSVRAVELVANALTPSRRTAASVSPDRASTSGQARRASPAASRKLSMDEYVARNGDSHTSGKRYYQ